QLQFNKNITEKICGAILITSLHLLTLTKCFQDSEGNLIKDTSSTLASHHVFIPEPRGSGFYLQPQFSEHSIVHYVVPILYT
ncbi:hypothetical protein PFISCL1PPCAC_18125, partial [Pristionchus fissidentatus]